MKLRSTHSKEIRFVTPVVDFLTGRVQTHRVEYQGLKELVSEGHYQGEMNSTFHTQGTHQSSYAPLPLGPGQMVLEYVLDLAEEANVWRALKSSPIREQIFQVKSRKLKRGKLWLSIRPDGTREDPNMNYVCTIDLFKAFG